MTSNQRPPDEIERFTHAALDCKIIKQDLGHWCGYVRRPPAVEPVRWQSDFGSKHDEVLKPEVMVWGGITYGPDDEGWVGFDDAHSRSLVDHREAETVKEVVKNETRSLAEQISNLRDQGADGE